MPKAPSSPLVRVVALQAGERHRGWGARSAATPGCFALRPPPLGPPLIPEVLRAPLPPRALPFRGGGAGPALPRL